MTERQTCRVAGLEEHRVDALPRCHGDLESHFRQGHWVPKVVELLGHWVAETQNRGAVASPEDGVAEVPGRRAEALCSQ